MGKLETVVEDKIVELAKAAGGVAIKGDVPGRRFLDRIIILPDGVTIYAECKRPPGGTSRGRLSAHQGATLDRLNRQGHMTWRVNTVEDVVRFFDGFMRVNRKYEYSRDYFASHSGFSS